MTTNTEAVTESPSRHTRVERMRQPLAADVVVAVAETTAGVPFHQHGDSGIREVKTTVKG